MQVTGGLTIDANVKPLQYVTLYAYGELERLASTLKGILTSLITSVEAADVCRCYKTEVCPICHTLDADIAAAKTMLHVAEMALNADKQGVTLGGAFTSLSGTSAPVVITSTASNTLSVSG